MQPADETQVNAQPAPLPWDTHPADQELPPVLHHALEAITESGYHAASVRDLARRLGQTVPSIYYHYESKQAILVALLSHAVDQLDRRLRDVAATPSRSDTERLADLVRCIVRFVMANPSLTMLDAESRSLEPANRAAYHVQRGAIQALVVDAVAAGMAAGEIEPGDPSMIARAVLTMCRGVAIWYRQDGRLGSDELAEEYVELALRLAGVRPTPTARRA